MPASSPSIPFAIALREVTDDASARIREGLRAERLLGILMTDAFDDSTGQGFGALLGDGGGRALVVGSDGGTVTLDAVTVAARLQRRLDASVQLDVGEPAELVESTPQGFEPWTVIPEREAEAERRAVRWVAVLPERAENAARWLSELASLVDGSVVLVPAGDRSLLVCDAWRFASWPRALRPVVAVQQSASSVALHAWTARRIDADGNGRRRFLPSHAPDWSAVWNRRPTVIMPGEGYSGVAPDAAASLEVAQRALIERATLDIPSVVDDELTLGSRRAALESLLALDLPELTPASIVAALGLPDAIVPLLSGELDAATLPGASTARRRSLGRTLVASVGEELRFEGRSMRRIRTAVGIGLFLTLGLSVAMLAGFGVITRQQVEDPWFTVVLLMLAALCAGIGHVVAAVAARRDRRASPLGDET